MKVRLFRLAIVASLFLTLVGQLVISPTTSAAASLHFLYGSGSQTGGKNIKLRVELTEPAPQGGVNVTMAVSNGAINVPPTIHVNTGETEKQVTVTTDPVMTNTDVTVSATLAGVTKSRDVLIKAPVLSSMGLQTVIRHGGVGKVIARISGPAPAGGFAVNTETDPSGHLDLDAVITIPAGETRLSLAVPASLFQDANGGDLLPDQPVNVTLSAGVNSYTRSTVIRDFGDEPRPTATATIEPTVTETATEEPTATETATEEPTATETATEEPTATETATEEPTATETATEEPTATETATPEPTVDPCELDPYMCDPCYYDPWMCDPCYYDPYMCYDPCWYDPYMCYDPCWYDPGMCDPCYYDPQCVTGAPLPDSMALARNHWSARGVARHEPGGFHALLPQKSMQVFSGWAANRT